MVTGHRSSISLELAFKSPEYHCTAQDAAVGKRLRVSMGCGICCSIRWFGGWEREGNPGKWTGQRGRRDAVAASFEVALGMD